ncbi:MAG: CheR family methyltransferase [Nanobdellota archaeon]
MRDPENIGRLKSEINRLIGFDCSQYSEKFIERRIRVRLRANDVDSISEYLRILNSDDEEKEKLDKELSIHVTHFFRDYDMWQAFMEEVIPLVGNLKRKVRIWSAGCSTGEEPVSIAISFLESGEDISFSIEATDIDHGTIEKAKQGIYEENQFREMPAGLKEKYFDDLGDGRYQVKPEVSRLIEYKIGDIHTYRPRRVDIIFCRNTVIYFNREAKARLYEDFYEVLNNDGFLVIGKTEVLQGEAREKLQILNPRERIYVKE